METDREPGLVQLLYASGKLDDAWRMMVCCVLLNQTTRTQLEKVREKVFERWPQAHRMAEADPDELYDAIRPCGLAGIRMTRLRRFSHDWVRWEILRLDTKHGPLLPTAAEVNAMYGIGKYATDSYRMFVLGEREGVHPGDKELLRWLRWYRRQVSAA